MSHASLQTLTYGCSALKGVGSRVGSLTLEIPNGLFSTSAMLPVRTPGDLKAEADRGGTTSRGVSWSWRVSLVRWVIKRSEGKAGVEKKRNQIYSSIRGVRVENHKRGP